MKRLLPLVLILAVLVSGCTSQSILATLRLNVVDSAVEEISVIAEIPSFIREGKTFAWNVMITPETDLENVNISVYDSSPFLKLAEGEIDNWGIPILKLNRTKQFQTKYIVQETEFEQLVKIKFLTEYDANTYISEGIPVLDDFEYEDRYSKNTLSEISYKSSHEESPLNIKISFDQDRPFMNDTRVLMYIDYSYSAEGIIKNIESGDVEITLPSNLEFIECRDYNFDNTIEEKIGEQSVSKNYELVEKTIKKFKIDENGYTIIADSIDTDVNSVRIQLIVNGEKNIFGLDMTTPVEQSDLTFELIEIEAGDLTSSPGTINKATVKVTNTEEVIIQEITNVGVLTLNKNKEFLDKKSTRSTCELKTVSDQPISTGTITAKAKYHYMIPGEAEIQIRKR
jgi:hypothetical protein